MIETQRDTSRLGHPAQEHQAKAMEPQERFYAEQQFAAFQGQSAMAQWWAKRGPKSKWSAQKPPQDTWPLFSVGSQGNESLEARAGIELEP